MCLIALATLAFLIQGGDTPLMWATMGRHVEVVRELIQAKADVNARDKVYTT